ncbi:alpha-L-fucosidase [Sphingomonas japonica]|uniref:alpha-L-fucosidase n=1 Tax=Sphingomonas japonica TaxID=511662 RepID=A0ABX0TW61_9SPHN|nr:alpha-L-fucosidase [Sphingomonas japonica]NIJ22559.1 alpha-L-fucosidase [Sphingomonas japonica]
MGGALGAATLPRPASARDIAPNWSALAAAWDVPEWFRDAKFGIWAHWSAQCVPEAGDWYGRLMYQQSHPHYGHHLKHYGHPADRGFLEIENLWKAENWEPEYLVRLYKAAGAKYFMALANHHDNLDAYDSAHHAWNTMRVGPKRDIVGGWEKAVRREGLKFGVSNHSAHAWHWYQTAYGYDAEGPRAGERYDAFKLTAADGKGKWWEGLDPQELYCGPSFVAPDGIASAASMDAWHHTHDGRWMEFIPPSNPDFARKWLLRQNDLVDKYRPDLVYFDNFGMPMEHLGLEAVAHYYSRATEWHGTPDVLATAKVLPDYDQNVLVDDVERGFSDRLRARPWQTCTCIGEWHYNRARFDQKSYVPAEQVIQRLCDVVSKNGNLLLSIPVRGDGTIDSEEEKIVAGITQWMQVHGEIAIHGSRPWRTFGEGPTDLSGGMFNEEKGASFTARDVRFTVKQGGLNVIFLKWPTEPIAVAALGSRALGSARIASAELVGGGEVIFDQRADAAIFTLPPPRAGAIVPVVRIAGRGIA